MVNTAKWKYLNIVGFLSRNIGRFQFITSFPLGSIVMYRADRVIG